MDRENREMKQEIEALKKKVRDMEQERDYRRIRESIVSGVPSHASSPEAPQESNELTGSHSSQVKPAFRAALTADSYMGMSAGEIRMNSLNGTALSIFGMEIDIADFESADMDEPNTKYAPGQPLYNKSYRAFLQSALGRNPKCGRVELPSREEGFNLAEWYFRRVNPYIPILHKPTFIELVSLRSECPFLGLF